MSTHQADIASIQKPRQSRVSFESIQEVVELSRRLALKDYCSHVKALVDAKDEQEKAIAVAALQESERAVRLADSVFMSMISAEAEFRGSTASMYGGDAIGARKQAAASRDFVSQAAQHLKGFAEKIKSSPTLAASLGAVSKIDFVAGKISAEYKGRADTFISGVKGYAARVERFADDVAKMPDLVADVAQSLKVSAADAVVSVAAKYMSGFRDVMKSALGRANDVVRGANVTAWTMIAECSDFVDRASDKAEEVVETVTKHSHAVGGVVAVNASAAAGLATQTLSLAGGLLSRVGRKLSEQYSEQLDNVDRVRAARRPGA